MNYDVPISNQQLKDKLRDEFVKNKYVTDIRAVDLLVSKVRNFTKFMCKVDNLPLKFKIYDL